MAVMVAGERWWCGEGNSSIVVARPSPIHKLDGLPTPLKLEAFWAGLSQRFGPARPDQA